MYFEKIIPTRINKETLKKAKELMILFPEDYPFLSCVLRSGVHFLHKKRVNFNEKRPIFNEKRAKITKKHPIFNEKSLKINKKRG